MVSTILILNEIRHSVTSPILESFTFYNDAGGNLYCSNIYFVNNVILLVKENYIPSAVTGICLFVMVFSGLLIGLDT